MAIQGSYNLSTVSGLTTLTSTGSVLIADVNPARYVITIQNVSTGVCYVKLGAAAASSSFHIIIPAETTAYGGEGGSIELNRWKGSVYGYGSCVIGVIEEVDCT